MNYYEQPYQYIAGDNYLLCDRCGRKIRRSEAKKTWDGLMVCHADFETRHPQEVLNEAKADIQAVRDARPRPTQTQLYIQTEVATAAVPGATTLVVDSIANMADGDSIAIQLDGGYTHSTTINGTPSNATITLTDAITDFVSVDNSVTVYNNSDFITQSDL